MTGWFFILDNYDISIFNSYINSLKLITIAGSRNTEPIRYLEKSPMGMTHKIFSAFFCKLSFFHIKRGARVGANIYIGINFIVYSLNKDVMDIAAATKGKFFRTSVFNIADRAQKIPGIETDIHAT